MNNWFYLIPFLVFFTLLVLLFKRNINTAKRNYLGLLVVALYVLSASLVYVPDVKKWYPYFSEESYTAFSFILYSVFLLFYLIPSFRLSGLNKEDIFKLPEPPEKLLYLICFLGLFSLFYQLPFALVGMRYDSDELRRLMDGGFFILPQNNITTLAVGVSYFFIFYIYFFIVSIIRNHSIFIKLSLFLGSFSYVISGMTFSTRDVFVFYLLSFIFVYLYTLELTKYKLKSLRVLMIFVIFMAVAGILSLSVERFSGRNSLSSFQYGTIGYVAQQPFVFSETIAKQLNFYGGYLRFPVFMGVFDQQKVIIRTEQYEWSFGTVIKDFYSEGGFIFLIFITIAFFIFFYSKLKRRRNTKLSIKLIIDFFYFQFVTMGIFYFNFGNRAGNLYMIILLFIGLYLNFSNYKIGSRK